MAQFNVASKRCPLCNSVAVEKADDNISFKRRASHRCTKCGAQLTTKMTNQVAWCVPAVAASIAVMWLTFPWLQHANIPSSVRAGLIGGIVGLGWWFSFYFLFRGIVFQPWEQ